MSKKPFDQITYQKMNSTKHHFNQATLLLEEAEKAWKSGDRNNGLAKTLRTTKAMTKNLIRDLITEMNIIDRETSNPVDQFEISVEEQRLRTKQKMANATQKVLLTKQRIDGIFDRAISQIDYLVELYAYVVPNWDAVKHCGNVKVTKETGLYIMEKAIEFDKEHHPDVMAGGAWLNRGFSTSAFDGEDWYAYPPDTIEYHEEPLAHHNEVQAEREKQQKSQRINLVKLGRARAYVRRAEGLLREARNERTDYMGWDEVTEALDQYMATCSDTWQRIAKTTRKAQKEN